MAQYHSTIKTVSRSAGRSATAAAAYRAAVSIIDKRTGEIHDFTRKRGVQAAVLVLPAGAPEWASDRAALWNAAEQAETRKNSTVAREFEVALPEELSPLDRKQLALELAGELVARHGCVADVAIHAPNKRGDQRNHHAHILLTTRRLEGVGFTEKTRELDDLKSGPQLVNQWRERWAEMGANVLSRLGFRLQADRYRVGHLRLDEQIEAARQRGDTEFVNVNEGREPARHLGPTATAIERRTGIKSRKRQEFDQWALDRLSKAAELGKLEREEAEGSQTIIDVSGDLQAAMADRDRVRKRIEAGMADIEQRFAHWEATKHAEQEQLRKELVIKDEQERQQRVSRLRELYKQLDGPQRHPGEKASGPDALCLDR